MKNMRKTCALVCAVLLGFTACVVNSGATREAGAAETEIIIRRADSPINAGFKEWVYIDGSQKLVLANGETGKIIVPNGTHSIHAELYSMTTKRISFTANFDTLAFKITPYSIDSFVIEQEEYVDNSLAGTLDRTVEKLMAKVPKMSRIWIANIVTEESEESEFIIKEMDSILDDQGFQIVDRGKAQALVQKERDFQASGSVSDDTFLSWAEDMGADVVITGELTGSGNLRRLRLRAVSVKTTRVVGSVSERY